MKNQFVRILSKPIPLVTVLYLCTFVPILVTMVRAVQISTTGLPDESAHLRGVPVDLFIHSVGGAVFGLLGPLQFANALRRRYGLLHRIFGWVFVCTGAALGLSGLTIVFQVQPNSMQFVQLFRFLAGLALLVSLTLAIIAAKQRAYDRHRGWMVRSYAIGMGSAAVALVALPILLITGETLKGLSNDVLFVGAWVTAILVGEWVVFRIRHKKPTHTVGQDVNPVPYGTSP